MVDVVSGSLYRRTHSKSSGLVVGRRPLGAILHSSTEPGELSQWLCHDDSTINIVICITIISLLSCNIISPQGLYTHPLLISYLFRNVTYHLDLVLSTSQPHGSGTLCLLAFANPSHFLL